MIVEFNPQGTCSRKMIVDVEDGVIKDLKVLGGCSGNLAGIGRLVKGMKAEEVIQKLEGTKCGSKATSCPDQLAKGLKRELGL
ncbi:MAG: TIGR03905 family TSCPD domain-containing protein [Thomasclavelia sp.]|nr:TIGR03905 family TSCPD domain-containing protein [Thomasclavelia sp.]